MRELTLPVVLLGVLLGGCTLPAAAQDTPADDDLPINFVFATQLGSGIYSVAGQTVQVYRIPVTHTIRKLEDDRKWGLRLRFPLTLGFADFDVTDVLEGVLPDKVETISLVPGAEFLIPIDRHWMLKPYVEAGAGTHFSGGQITWVYSGGIRAEGEFPTKKFTYMVSGDALYAGQYAAETGLQDDVGLVRAGFDARHPLWFSFGGGKATGGLYLRSFLYTDQLRFRRPGERPFDMDKQWEAGFTIGRPKPFKWWWISIKHPRFGLGYRWGEDFWAVRLVLGNPI